MSIRSMALRPIGGIKSNPMRRLALVIYGAPVVIALQVGQVLLAPIAIFVVFAWGACRGLIEAFNETVDCIVASTKAEPESWRVMFQTLRRIWRWDRETWAAKQPRILRKPAQPLPPIAHQDER